MSVYNNNYIHQQQDAPPPPPQGPPPDASFFDNNQNTQQQQHFNNHTNQEYQHLNHLSSALPAGGNKPKTETDMLEDFFGPIPAAVSSSSSSQKVQYQQQQPQQYPQQQQQQPQQSQQTYQHSTFPQQAHDQPSQNSDGYHHSSYSHQQQQPQQYPQQQQQQPQQSQQTYQHSTFPQQTHNQPPQNSDGYHHSSSSFGQPQQTAAVGESVSTTTPQPQQQRQEYSQPQQYATTNYQPSQQPPIVGVASVIPPQQNLGIVQQTEPRNPPYHPSSVGYQPPPPQLQQQQQLYQPPQQQFQQYPPSYAANTNLNSNNITGTEPYSPTVNYPSTRLSPAVVANAPQTTITSYVAPAAPQQSQVDADKARLQEIIRLRKELEREQERERKEREEKNCDTWGCTQCTFRNKIADVMCAMCQKERPGKEKKATSKNRDEGGNGKKTKNNGDKTSSDSSSNDSGTWMCSTCAYFNPESLRNCKVCQTKRRSEDSVNKGTLKQRATRANHKGGPEADEYSCPTCTLFNKKTLGVCDACGCPNPFYVASNNSTNTRKKSKEAKSSSSSSKKWSCPVCTFDNVPASFQCEVCSAPNPNPQKPPVTSGPTSGSNNTRPNQQQDAHGYPGQPQTGTAAIKTPTSPAEATSSESHNVKWQEDNVVLNCNKCNAMFGMMLRRHHCRACGFVFCYYCSNNKVELVPGGVKERVCIDCYRERLK